MYFPYPIKNAFYANVAERGRRLLSYYIRVSRLEKVWETLLYIIDDCSASRALSKKRDMLSELAFSWRHSDQSVWILTQKYNSVLKDLCEQTRWVALFHCKNCGSFKDCLRENDVIPSCNERAAVLATAIKNQA